MTTMTILPRMRVMRGRVSHQVEAYEEDGELRYRSKCRWRNSYRKGHKVHGPAGWWVVAGEHYPRCAYC